MKTKTWSERITDLEAAGWSLASIATNIGLSPQALSDIKQKRTTEPRGMAAVLLFSMDGAKPKKRRKTA